ncbi:MAG: LCP family protein [Erysipelotrichaceae bacterium]
MTGVDTFGPIDTKGRSDVNIVLTINPVTKQVLLTSVPRDYYVPLSCGAGYLDKLTHAGLYGVDCSIDTLETLLDVDIDFYVRVNFTSVVDIVDKIGGIDAESKYNFYTIDGQYFSQGINHMNGTQTLAFVRERKNLPNGDLDRGVHQMETIKALANKAPSMLANYQSVLDIISKSFQTNMSQDQIAELVRMQLKDMASWNIVSQFPVGYGSMEPTYSGGAQPLSVIIPDEASLQLVRDKIQSVFDGATLTP